MIKFAQKTYQEMRLAIQEEVKKDTIGIDLYNNCYRICKQALCKVSAHISSRTFPNKHDEITFYKEIKPQMHGEVLYYVELIQMELQRPASKQKKIQLGYLRQLSGHYSYLLKRYSLVQLYIKSGRTHEDHYMFTHQNDVDYIYPCDPLLDQSPPASNELAQIITYERLLEYIGKEIESLKTNKKIFTDYTQHLNWTGSKTSLIELAYALHASNGNLELKKIIKALEHLFQVNLGNFYRTFQNIRIRQGSRTQFLDELRNNLVTYMDRTDMRQ